MKKLTTTILVFPLSLALSACGGTSETSGTTPRPTYTPAATSTLPRAPTITPSPIATPQPETTTAGLADQVENLFYEAYGEFDDWSTILSFSDQDAPRVTVATDMAYKDENKEEAMNLCRSVTSISHSVTERFIGVYVTAGEGGPFLAECDVWQ